MLLEQTVQVKWSGNNKIHYENKGYKYTKCGEYFNCKAEDLSIGSDYRVKVQCDYCGEIYDKQFKKYILHRNILAKDACQKCQNKKCRDIKLIKYGCCSPKIFCNWEALNNQRFIIVQNNIWKQIQTICKERDYILISKSYKNNHSKIQYICNKHFNEGIKEINWIHLRDGEGCKSCGIEKRALNQRFTQAEVKKIIEYDYKEYGCKLIGKYINYNDYNLKLRCNCGEIFTTSLSWFINGRRKCNVCSCSNGEFLIHTYLKENNIDYISEKKFKDCIYIKKLEFDFYLPQLNIIIEFDGEQHYFPVRFNGISLEEATESFNNGKIRDEIKNKYCIDNNIPLLRIPYWEKNNIKTILDEYINNIKQQENQNKDSLVLCSNL